MQLPPRLAKAARQGAPRRRYENTRSLDSLSALRTLSVARDDNKTRDRNAGPSTGDVRYANVRACPHEICLVFYCWFSLAESTVISRAV
jgi:hypothetical protein